MTVPTRLVLIGEIAWRIKRFVECVLTVVPHRWRG